MSTEEFSTGPTDIPPGQIMVVDEIQVAEWSPGTVDQDVPATQVHIVLKIPDFPVQLAIRLKTRARVEWLCATLMKHADGVWPKRS